MYMYTRGLNNSIWIVFSPEEANQIRNSVSVCNSNICKMVQYMYMCMVFETNWSIKERKLVLTACLQFQFFAQ